MNKESETKVEVHYKIYDPQTKKYSTGGYHPGWNDEGKTWKQLGHLKNHLNCLIRNASYQKQKREYPYHKDVQLISFMVVTTTTLTDTELVTDLIKEMDAKKEAKRQRATEVWADKLRGICG